MAAAGMVAAHRRGHARCRPSWIRVVGLVGLAGLALAAACAPASDDVAGGGPPRSCTATPDDVELDTATQARYPSRADVQAEDHEAPVGECVRVSGYSTTVVGASAVYEPLTRQGLVVVRVRIRNRDDVAQPYADDQFRLQSSTGVVVDPTWPVASEQPLGRGDLVAGGEVVGDVVFDVAPGEYYVLYKPDALDAVRGVWRVSV